MHKIAQRLFPDPASKRYSLAYFTLFMVYGVVSPYLQLLVRGLGYAPSEVGLFLAFFEIVGILGPLVLARRADASGRRKPALMASGLAIIAALPALALIRNPLATGLSIALLAVGVKTLVPVMDAAAVSFVNPASAHSEGTRGSYGSLRVMGSVGFIFTALVLQALPGFDRSPPWKIALCVGIATCVFLSALAFLPEADMPAPREEGGKAEKGRFNPLFALGLVIIGLSRFAMAPINSFVSLYATEYLHLDAVGGLWALASASEIPFMLVSVLIVARIGPMAAIAVSTAAVGLRLGIMALVPTPGGLFAAQLLHSLCYGLFQPAAVAFVTEMVPPARRSSGMAVFMGLGVGLPAVLGSALGGFVIEAGGYRILFASFIGFAVLSLALYAFTRRRFGLRA
jgi:PPP family 3-phenylpropionic acid transporter